MSFQINIPPSVVSKMAKTEKTETLAAIAEEEPTGKKREDWRKLKELEEARKAGTAPAMQDEEGKDINPHIPQYIMQAPWYTGATQATLRHQREPDYMKKVYNKMDEWYKKGVKMDSIATKYRKGACENCGAMTHKRKECVDRPRKLGACFTGERIAPDEHIQPDLGFDFEGKRDRWNGYDVEDYKRVLAEYQKQEEAKRVLKGLKLEKSMDGREESVSIAPDGDDDDNDEDDKYADDMAMPGQKFETKQRITVRNLRIREDTAKYLFNLDLESAHYDPKTRAMRENPFEEKGLAARDLPYAGDNFVRWSGDAHDMAKNQMFSWEAYEKGTEAHLQADPTKLEMLQREYGKKKEDFKDTVKNSILEKYGGQEHLESLPKQLLLAPTEHYVEYSRHGTLVRGQEKAKVKSRYEEDVYERNHTGVWGSYWREGRWGYSCCHSLIRQSYCIGRAGKEQSDHQPLEDDVRDEAVTKETEKTDAEKAEDERLIQSYDPDQPKTLLQQHLEMRVAEEKKSRRQEKKKAAKKSKKKKKNKKSKKHQRESSDSDHSSSSSSSEEEEEETDKVKAALKREEKRLKQVEEMMSIDERKRPYNIMYDGKGPTEEDIEAFQIKRVRHDDPMANFTKD